MQVGAVRKAPLKQTLRTVGRVAPDETRVRRISAADGWIDKIYPVSTESLVHKGDLLATVYSKDSQAAQLAYIYALRAAGKLPENHAGDGGAYSQLSAAEKELRSAGMSDIQMAEIARTGKSVTDIDLRTPITGFILVRNAMPGMKFTSDTELYRVADLTRVWIVAELFETDAGYLRPGLKAKVSLPSENRFIEARVINIPPEFDAAAHTLQVRLETDNPGYKLRPGMYADVELSVESPPTLSVPSDAVVDTGTRKVVFVERGNGNFEPRRVVTGLRSDNRVEILSGLAEGERVALSGNFYLDSESRLKTRDGVYTDAACGMRLDPERTGLETSVYRGVTYHFCSSRCKQKFDGNPAAYAAKVLE